jgi:hypothetical protein
LAKLLLLFVRLAGEVLVKSQPTSLKPDGEIAAFRPPSLGLAKAIRPQSHWFFLAAGEAGVARNICSDFTLEAAILSPFPSGSDANVKNFISTAN